MKAYAHSGNLSDRSDWQLLEDHLFNVAQLAAKAAEPFKLSTTSYLAGVFHDFGKYNPEFDKVLKGKKIHVDHSTAGGRYLIDFANNHDQKLIAQILAHTILGHHSGLPNTFDDTNSNLTQRIYNHQKNSVPGFGKKINMLMTYAPGDLSTSANELITKIHQTKNGFNSGFAMSVAGRMIFSCLVDSDYRDTELFYEKLEDSSPLRVQGDLNEKLKYLIASYDKHMEKLISSAEKTNLNVNRLKALQHIREKASMEPGFFTLTVPTGGGKTLASLGFALDHAKHHDHRRIIYAIPYTSIIEQTASIFRGLFDDKEIVLEHHTSIDENENFEARKKIRLAMEDWSRPIVVTTNVQLFESLFSNRPSKCRKIHNIAGSIIVLDEAQCLPRNFLIPILAMLDVLVTHYDCSVIFCTATQPVFDSRQLKNGGLKLEDREIAPKQGFFTQSMQRSKVIDVGYLSDDDLISELKINQQGVVIVNTRQHALDLYKLGNENGLQGLIHLTTRQHADDRRKILKLVSERLRRNKTCRLIATSLIEAGVDLDFPVGWRAEAGLDSIIQAAGRVNREGRNPLEKSILKVFKCSSTQKLPKEIDVCAKATWRVVSKHENMVSPEAIMNWFEEVYWQMSSKSMGNDLIEKFKFNIGSVDLPYRLVSEQFKLIQSNMVPIIIWQHTQSDHSMDPFSDPKLKSYELARQMQPFTVQVPKRIRDDMIYNGHASFKSPDFRGNQFCLLDNLSLYSFENGLVWDDLDDIGSGII
ncbi:MAG: CRISPR-associated helicase Cas3' [Rhodobacteraceae bacterium]|nr:CRISPR-associated helicase Cas3' [Paracoccaceae bacterium]